MLSISVDDGNDDDDDDDGDNRKLKINETVFFLISKMAIANPRERGRNT